jgi:hypothetical protein
MEYLKNNKIKNEIIESLKDKLQDYKDTEEYACDLGYTLYQEEDADGCIFANTQESIDWIKNNYEDIGEIWEELKFNFGNKYMAQFDPFDNPEKVALIIYLEVASYLLGQCETIQDYWNSKIQLTDKNIKKISKELDELKD